MRELGSLLRLFYRSGRFCASRLYFPSFSLLRFIFFLLFYIVSSRRRSKVKIKTGVLLVAVRAYRVSSPSLSVRLSHHFHETFLKRDLDPTDPIHIDRHGISVKGYCELR
jgi:hypothetical protein